MRRGAKEEGELRIEIESRTGRGNSRHMEGDECGWTGQQAVDGMGWAGETVRVQPTGCLAGYVNCLDFILSGVGTTKEL